MNARDNHNNTPLHLAAWQDSLRVATLLVEEGANVSLKSHFGRTPLQHAARFDSINVAKLLLNKSCDEMNVWNNYNKTLFWSFQSNTILRRCFNYYYQTVCAVDYPFKSILLA